MWIGDSELSRRKHERTSGMFGMLHVLICVLAAYTKIHRRDFLGSPVVKTPRSQSRGPGFNPLSRKFCVLQGIAKKKKDMG